MTARSDELRKARLLFERAQAAGTTPDALRRREAMIRWDAADRRLAAQRSEQDTGKELAWWQR